MASHQWLIALPQLLSRICHRDDNVAKILIDLLAALLLQYSSVMAWHVCGLGKSKRTLRASRYSAIIKRLQELDGVWTCCTPLCAVRLMLLLHITHTDGRWRA